MERAEMIELQRKLEALRPVGADYLIVAVGVRGPNFNCDDGNAVATVRMGGDEATSEALYLPDAIALARGKILRSREEKKQGRPRRKEPAHG